MNVIPIKIYEKIWETSPQGMVLSDENGIVTAVNKKYCEIYGYKKEYLIGKKFSVLLPETEREFAELRYRKAINTGVFRSTNEIEVEKSDNTKWIVEVHTQLFTENSQKMMFSTIIDITEKRIVEKEKNENEANLKAVFNNTLQLFIMVSLDYKIISVNKIAKEYYKNVLEKEINEGQCLLDLLYQPHVYDFKHNFSRALEGSIIEVEKQVPFRGDYLYFNYNYIPVLEKKGEVKKVIFTILDVTEKKRMERKVKESEERLKLKLDYILLPDAHKFDFKLIDIISIEKLQEMQDSFAAATGVASVITDTTGQVITQPSNFCGVCSLIRKTDKGKANCFRSDKTIGEKAKAAGKPVFEKCHSCGFVDAGAPIVVGDQFLGIWMIGQASLGDVNEKRIKDYSKEIGANDAEMLTEYRKMQSMDLEQFKNVTNLLWVFANEVSTLAYSNISLAKKHEEQKEFEKRIINSKKAVELSNERLESLLRVAQMQTGSIQTFLDFSLREAIKLTESKIGYIYYYSESNRQFILNSWSKQVMQECEMLNQQTVFDLDKTGCWGEAVRQRKPIIINDYNKSNPYVRGTPEGHISLKKFLTVPVFIDDRIVAVIGVANKSTDYNKYDVRQLQLLMDNVWKIAERIDLTNNLKQAKEKAEESNKLKTAFLQNISHEFRTPMNGILGFSNLLTQQDISEEQRGEYVEIIKDNCERLLGIVTDTIDISEIQCGSATINIEQGSLIELLQNIIEQTIPKANSKGLELIYNLSPTIKDLVLKTDIKKIQRSLIHIIDNAIKFTQRGKVEVISEAGNKSVRISITDTGIGIPYAKQKIIFEPYRQAETNLDRNLGGNGIGLSLAKTYIEMLGGKLDLKSKINKGTSVIINLPLYFTE